MTLDFNLPVNITKELLLSKHSQETYLEHYLGVRIAKGLFKSPLRGDKTPTCSFYKNPKGDILMKDFGSNFCGNFIAVVMEKFNCSYYKALKIIANDFGIVKDPKMAVNEKLIDYSGTVMEDKGQTILQIEARDFTEQELKWWKKFGISKETLIKFHVFSCKNIFLNGEFSRTTKPTDPMYGYYGGIKEDIERWRIYMPLRKSYRFMSNWKKTMIQGAQMIPKNGGDILVITKSMKDVMLFHELGITAIAPNSETNFLTEAQLAKVKRMFKHVYLLYDNDLAGISAMNRIRKEHDIKCIWLPRDKAKDISDYYAKYGKKETVNLINTFKQSI